MLSTSFTSEANEIKFSFMFFEQRMVVFLYFIFSEFAYIVFMANKKLLLKELLPENHPHLFP